MKKIRKAIAEKFKNWKRTTNAKGDDIEESRAVPADVEEVKVEIKKQTSVDKATETDSKLCNINSEDLQPICESNEEAQIETTVEPTSVDRETNEQEPNPAEIELCFTTDEKDKPPTKTTQQRQAIVAGVVGAVLLVSCVASYLLIESSKVHVIAVIGGIVGLVCMGFALYNAIKPGTKLEKVGVLNKLCQTAFLVQLNFQSVGKENVELRHS